MPLCTTCAIVWPVTVFLYKSNFERSCAPHFTSNVAVDPPRLLLATLSPRHIITVFFLKREEVRDCSEDVVVSLVLVSHVNLAAKKETAGLCECWSNVTLASCIAACVVLWQFAVSFLCQQMTLTRLVNSPKTSAFDVTVENGVTTRTVCGGRSQFIACEPGFAGRRPTVP